MEEDPKPGSFIDRGESKDEDTAEHHESPPPRAHCDERREIDMATPQCTVAHEENPLDTVGAQLKTECMPVSEVVVDEQKLGESNIDVQASQEEATNTQTVVRSSGDDRALTARGVKYPAPAQFVTYYGPAAHDVWTQLYEASTCKEAHKGIAKLSKNIRSGVEYAHGEWFTDLYVHNDQCADCVLSDLKVQLSNTAEALNVASARCLTQKEENKETMRRAGTRTQSEQDFGLGGAAGAAPTVAFFPSNG
jgi:hypothetical protein